MSYCNSVEVVTELRAGRQEVYSRQSTILILHIIQGVSGTHPAYSPDTRIFTSMLKWPEHEVHHTPSFTAHNTATSHYCVLTRQKQL